MTKQTERRAGGALEGIDLDDFWDDCEYSLSHYVEPHPSNELIASIEAEIGYTLPAAYIELARLHNGGMVTRSCFPMTEATSWADDHIAVTGLYAIGRTARYSLCGELGATFMQREWGYPPIGVCIADTPSAGHDAIMLDYRACGPTGEPQVVHVDQESDYRITVVAPDFASFIRGLVNEDVFDTTAEDRAADLAKVEQGTLSPIVVRALGVAADRLPDGERVLRTLARKIVDDKGHFSLHADARSHLMYSLMFWLYSQLATATSFEDFARRSQDQIDYQRPCYELMIVTRFVAQPYGFCTGGWSESFVQDWWEAAVARGDLVQTAAGWRLSEQAEQSLLAQLGALGGER